jgi:hypothetical protein
MSQHEYEREIMLDVMSKSNDKYQVAVAIEEMAELTFALVKHYFRESERIDRLIEEIADVEVMLHQLKIVIEREIGREVYDEVAAVRLGKLERLQKRIRDGVLSIDSARP